MIADIDAQAGDVANVFVGHPPIAVDAFEITGRMRSTSYSSVWRLFAVGWIAACDELQPEKNEVSVFLAMLGAVAMAALIGVLNYLTKPATAAA